MNIAIITPIFPPEIGGPATYVPELAERLTRLGHTITVITFASEPITKKYPFKVYSVNTSGNNLLRQWRLLFTIIRRAARADVVYVQGTITVGTMASLWSWLTGKKLVIKFVGDEVWEQSGSNQTLDTYYSRSPRSLKLTVHRLILRQAQMLITPSHSLAKFLFVNHSVVETKITVVANPVASIPNDKSKKQAKRLIYVGRLVRWKNVDLIIKAVARTRPKHGFELLLVGDGPQRASLEALVKEIDAADFIIFKGQLAKASTRKHIAQSQALILYSDYEGQAHVLIEALQLGTAVVVSDIPANRELIGKHGNLVEPNNLEALSQSLGAIKPVKPSTSRFFIKRHSWDQHLEDLLKCI